MKAELRGHSKINFSKSRPDIKNLVDRIVDMVTNFTPPALLGHRDHAGQYFLETPTPKNTFFQPWGCSNPQNSIFRSKSRFFENVQKWLLGMFGGRKTCSEVQRTVLHQLWTIWMHLQYTPPQGLSFSTPIRTVGTFKKNSLKDSA